MQKLRLQINAEDDLPKNLCRQCVADLNQTYEFFKKCHKSQETLLYTTCSDTENAVKEETDLMNDYSNDGLEGFSLQLEEEEDCITKPPDTKPIIETTTSEQTKQSENSDEFNQQMKTGIKRHECPQCQKKFFASYILAEHMRTHTKERPYACNECSATFSFKSSLRRHGLVHSGLKAYRCGTCSKGETICF